MKKLLIPLILLALLGGCAQTSEAPELLEPVKVETDKEAAKFGEIYNITMYEAMIKPEVKAADFQRLGAVKEIYFTLGDTVKVGDTIAILDTSDEQAEADSLAAELVYLTRLNKIEAERAELEILELENQGATALNTALIEQKKALASQEAERAAMELSELKEKLEETEGKIAAAAAIAPCDGTIVSMPIVTGSNASKGAPAAYIASDDTMVITTEFIKTDDLAAADKIYASIGGQIFDVTNVPYERSVYISLATSGAELRSTFTIDNPTDDIQNGMFTCIYIRKDYVENTLIIPSVALKTDSRGEFVYLVTDEGQTRRDIKTGVKTDALIEVLDGLEEGDVVFAGS